MPRKITTDADRTREIVDGIRNGLADIAAGRVIDHDEAMDQLDALIAEIRNRKG